MCIKNGILPSAKANGKEKRKKRIKERNFEYRNFK
jgi:hypothetical protein